MTASEERIPRPRAARSARRPPRRGVNKPTTKPAEMDSWFSYDAPGDSIVWSEALGEMLGQVPAKDDVSRQVLARYVHREDQATALSAITRAWTTRETVRFCAPLEGTPGGWRAMSMMTRNGSRR